MPNINKKQKDEMLAMLEKAESQQKQFKSIAAEMYRFAPTKLNTSQKNKVKKISEVAADLIVKGIPDAKKKIKRHYEQADWERDCKLVEDVLVIGTGKIALYAQSILNECNGEFGRILEASLDTTVVPTLKLSMQMIRNACDMVNYCAECLEEAFHDDWDLIVEVDDIKPEKAIERYRKAAEMLDADMRKLYEQKKKSLEKKYGDSIHRSKCPDIDFYVDAK